MEYEVRHNTEIHHDEQPRCPRCGTALAVKLLTHEDEDSVEVQTLLHFDRPAGHVHAALTHQDVMALPSAEVSKRLGFGPDFRLVEDAPLPRPDNRLGPRVHPELVVNGADVVTHRLGSDTPLRRDSLVA